MQQRFNTRNYSVQDFEEWEERDELVLSPKFQRRDVWNAKAKSFLIDTIIRGKPIPKLYMRQDVNPSTRRTRREIVDGQQRLRTVLSFVKDGFKISRTHNADYGNRYFSGLDEETQGQILRYEFVVDLLQDMPDNEVYDLFARINTYAEKLKAQELRNAQWFGEFKSSAYSLSNEFLTFFEANKVFTPKSILRMSEAEFVSQLLLAIHEGVREGNKGVIDKAYEDYDDTFTGRRRHEKQFKETMDAIGGVFGDDLAATSFRATRFLYPLFCAVYHLKFKLLKLAAPRKSFRAIDYPKMRSALDGVDDLIRRIKAAEDDQNPIRLSADDRKFHAAYSRHWVHASNRVVLTKYLCRKLVTALD